MVERDDTIQEAQRQIGVLESSARKAHEGLERVEQQLATSEVCAGK